MLARRMLWPCVCPSVCLSQAGDLSKLLNITTHGGLGTDAKDLDEILMGTADNE